MPMSMAEHRWRVLLSPRTLAERAGVSLALISQIERGDYTELRPRIMRKIAKALGTHPNEVTEFVRAMEQNQHVGSRLLIDSAQQLLYVVRFQRDNKAVKLVEARLQKLATRLDDLLSPFELDIKRLREEGAKPEAYNFGSRQSRMAASGAVRSFIRAVNSALVQKEVEFTSDVLVILDELRRSIRSTSDSLGAQKPMGHAERLVQPQEPDEG